MPLSGRAAVHGAYECCGFQPPGQLTYILGTAFGSAGGVQLAIYNKTEQARATEKFDYWESVWKRRDSFDENDPDNYNPDQDVWRVELRYHHSIIQQFASGSVDVKTGEAIDTRSFAAFSGHLDGLWRYGLGQFKLLARPGYFAPIWTLIRDDVRVDLPVDSLLDDTEYKRYYKTSRGFSGKNVELFLGNFVSLLARERVGAKKALLPSQLLSVTNRTTSPP